MIMGSETNHRLGPAMAKNKKYEDFNVKSNFKRLLAIVEYIFEIIGFSRSQNFQKDFW